MKRIQLTGRCIIRISGEDSRTFLQGLISNDIHKADGTRGIYAALLTPQGKFLSDFFIVADGADLLLDGLKSDAEALLKKLTMFKLRSKATLEDVTDEHAVYALLGDGAAAMLTDDKQTKTDDGAILFADPRLANAGVRVIAPAGMDATALGGENGSEDEYQKQRISLGLPEAPFDLEKEKSILLESGFDELSGVDWNKGCYMGQELTARTKYRGLVKKRLFPVTLSRAGVEPGTDVMQGGKVVGEIRSVMDDRAIAMLRLKAIGGGDMSADSAVVHPAAPEWMQLPESDDAEA